MNTEQIKSHISDFFRELEAELNGNENVKLCFVAGGVFASLVLDENVKDYDVWFKTIESWEACADEAQKNGIIIRSSRFSETIKLKSGKIVQLIKNRIGEPEKTIAGFDFKHTQAYCTYDGILVADEEYLRSRNLSFISGNLEHPTNTFQRVLKFARRGYWISQTVMIDLILDLQRVDPDQIKADRCGSR